MTAFMRSAFVSAVQASLDQDADRFQLAAAGHWDASMGAWLAANTFELSASPADWPPEFRELWAAILTARMQQD